MKNIFPSSPFGIPGPESVTGYFYISFPILLLLHPKLLPPPGGEFEGIGRG